MDIEAPDTRSTPRRGRRSDAGPTPRRSRSPTRSCWRRSSVAEIDVLVGQHRLERHGSSTTPGSSLAAGRRSRRRSCRAAEFARWMRRSPHGDLGLRRRSSRSPTLRLAAEVSSDPGRSCCPGQRRRDGDHAVLPSIVTTSHRQQQIGSSGSRSCGPGHDQLFGEACTSRHDGRSRRACRPPAACRVLDAHGGGIHRACNGVDRASGVAEQLRRIFQHLHCSSFAGFAA